MPDLNLQDEGSLDNLESSGELGDVTTTPEEAPVKSGGGIGKILLVVLAVLIVVGGGGFLLDKLGVIHVFGKKKATPSVVQLEQPSETVAPSGDTAQAQMIETPPVEEKGKATAGGEKAAAKQPAAKPAAKEKPQAPAKEMPAAAKSEKLQDMKGEYTVQVSAWRDKEIAQEMVKRLGEGGYPAFVEEREYKGGMWYTVRVGRYASRKEAQAAVENFAEELKSNYWIDRAKAK